MKESTAHKQIDSLKAIVEEHAHEWEQVMVSDCTDLSLVKGNLNELITVTQWSFPDSLGEQYPIRTIEIDRNASTEKKINKQSGKQVQSNLQSQSQIKDNSSIHERSNSEVVEKNTTKVTTPSWLLGLLGIIGLIVFLVIVGALKRIRIW